MSIIYINPYQFAAAYDPDAQSYITAVETADGQALEVGVKDAINAFVVGCKSDGIWNAIKASCILAGARTLAGALVPLVGTAPTPYFFVEGDYNRETGLVGDGNTKSLDSNRAGNADPQNSQHLSVYASTASTSSSVQFPFYIGAGRSSAGSTHIGRFSNNGNLFTRNRSASFNSSSASTAGFLAMNRSQSGSYITRFASLNKTITQVSQTPYSGNVRVFWSSEGTNDDYSDARIAFYSIGESLNLALLDTRVTTLINAFAAAIP